MPKAWITRTGIAVSIAIVAVGVAVVTRSGNSEASPEPWPVAVLAADSVRGDLGERATVPVSRFRAGEALVPTLSAFATPDPAAGDLPIVTASNPTHEGFPLIVSVIRQSSDGQWLDVRLPQRPNGIHGWIRAADVRTWELANRIEIDLGDFRLRVFDGDSRTVLFETDVAVGTARTPTPVGDFFIDIVNPLGGHPVYGWGQLSVSGFSDVLERFAGGIGQIALHGWNDNSVMGSSISNGCVRMRNDDIARVAELAPLGTPVIISE